MLELILAVVVVYVVYVWMTMKPSGYPPGPPALPFIGCLPFIEPRNMHFSLEQMRDKYGPIIGLKFGNLNAVAVCGPKEVMQVLKMEEFQGRPYIPLPTPLLDKGIMFEDGPYWVENRRFALQHLRDFGFGKRSNEDMILEEVEDFFRDCIRGKEVVEVSRLFNPSAIKVLWEIMAGHKFDRNDAEFKTLLFYLNRLFRSGNVSGGVLGALPFLRHVFPKWTGWADIVENDNYMMQFYKKSIEQHRKSRKNEEDCDVIDAYLRELEREGTQFTEQTIVGVCNDMFSAGAESTGNTVSFAIIYLIRHPDIQEQLYQEIVQVIGTDRKPAYNDRIRMPKTEAFLCEVARCNTIAPFTVPHRCTKETQINGHTIPKDSFLLISLWCLFQDEEHWGDPKEFRPDRFLDKEGKFVKDDWLIHFGMGKRVCVGESVARMMLFLFLTSLLQEFKLSLPKDHMMPSTVCLPGFTSAPRPCEMAVTPRRSLD